MIILDLTLSKEDMSLRTAMTEFAFYLTTFGGAPIPRWQPYLEDFELAATSEIYTTLENLHFSVHLTTIILFLSHITGYLLVSIISSVLVFLYDVFHYLFTRRTMPASVISEDLEDDVSSSEGLISIDSIDVSIGQLHRRH